MPQANVIRWRDGAGWLVLSGGDTSDTGDIEADALAHVQAGAGLTDEAQALRRQAITVLETIAQSTASAELRASLRALPDAREVLQAA